MIKLVYLKDLEKYMMAPASEGPLVSRLSNDILRRLDPYQSNGTTLWMWVVRVAKAEGGDMDVKEESYQTLEFIQRMDWPTLRWTSPFLRHCSRRTRLLIMIDEKSVSSVYKAHEFQFARTRTPVYYN